MDQHVSHKPLHLVRHWSFTLINSRLSFLLFKTANDRFLMRGYVFTTTDQQSCETLGTACVTEIWLVTDDQFFGSVAEKVSLTLTFEARPRSYYSKGSTAFFSPPASNVPCTFAWKAIPHGIRPRTSHHYYKYHCNIGIVKINESILRIINCCYYYSNTCRYYLCVEIRKIIFIKTYAHCCCVVNRQRYGESLCLCLIPQPFTEARDQ